MRKFGALAFLMLTASPAIAGKPYDLGGVTVTPSVDGRFRYELVDQTNTLAQADAVTLRLRPSLTFGIDKSLSLLVEGEGTLAIVEDYNSTVNGKTGFATIPDPENLEINRLQLQYKSKAVTLTAGRQRINLDDQRFVGSVGWRQNEQTFDAVRGEGKIGPVLLDATYAWSQRTVFGIDAGPRRAFNGNYVFLGAGSKVGPINVKGFAYLLDYAAHEPVAANSTQTYGLRATGAFKLTPKIMLNVAASYANQSDYSLNPVDYSVDYLAGELGLVWGDYGLTAGYESLGSSKGKSFQTPLATLHKFNGWADMFLTTPGQGLQDVYLGASAKFPKVKALPGLNAAVTWHSFSSDVGGQKFGKEWDAQFGFKATKSISLLAKYAEFDRTGVSKFTGDFTTRKFWLQAEFAL
jgi:hypothetical protein